MNKKDQNEGPQLSKQLVANIGLFHSCYELSKNEMEKHLTGYRLDLMKGIKIAGIKSKNESTLNRHLF